MDNQVLSGVVAVAVGLALAVALFVPFVRLNFRRDGYLTLSRTVLWVGFLVYATALWTYTLLPLPDPTDIVCVPAQTRPLQFIDDIRRYGTATPRETLTNPAVLQFALNVILFAPLGLFLRRLWGRGVVWTTVIGFGLSLLIETTQYTGVWGVYRCAYRFFDVDDLLANTSGALVGAVAAAVVAGLHRRLVGRADAGRDAVDSAPGTSAAPGVPVSGDPVSRARRTVGALCDLLVVALLALGAAVAVNLWQTVVVGRYVHEVDTRLIEQVAAWVPVVVTALVVAVTGRTVGDAAVEIRFVPLPGHRGIPEWLRRVVRFLVGAGGWQLLGVSTPAALLFLLVGAVAVWAGHGRGGLPGLVGGTRPVSTFVPDRPDRPTL